MRPCQGRDRGFESRHPRHRSTDVHTSVVFFSLFALSSPHHCSRVSAPRTAVFVALPTHPRHATGRPSGPMTPVCSAMAGAGTAPQYSPVGQARTLFPLNQSKRAPVDNRSSLRVRARPLDWVWYGVIVCCMALAVWGARQAAYHPSAVTPQTMGTPSALVLSRIEVDRRGMPFRWVASGYLIPVTDASGDGVLRVRLWVLPTTQTATLVSPNGPVLVPVPLLISTRMMWIWVQAQPWWRRATVSMRVVGTSDTPPAVAFGGLDWRGQTDERVALAGVWVLVIALCGRRHPSRWVTVACMLIAVGALWCWPAGHVWLGTAVVLTLVGALPVWWPSLNRYAAWLWGGALVLTAGITIARMIRRPSDFAELHWLLNYDAGFVKRGLIGSLLPNGWQTESGIWWLSAGVFSVALLGHAVGLVWVLRRPTRDPMIWMTALVIACSPVALMQGFLVGYADALVVLGVAGGFWWVRPNTRTPVWVGLIWALIVLVHESAIVYVCAWALVVVAMAFDQSGTRSRRHCLVALWHPLWVVILPIASLCGLMLAQQFQSVSLVHAGILARAAAAPFATQDSGYDVARQVADWTMMPFAAHYAKYHALFWERLTSREGWVMVPTLVTLWLCVGVCYRTRPWLWAGLVAATLVPIGLISIAVDTARIMSYTVIIGWYSLLCIVRAHPADQPMHVPWWFVGGAVVLVGCNAYIQPDWLVPYDVHAVLPLHPWLIVLPALVPIAWHIGVQIRPLSARCNGQQHDPNLF